MLFVFENIIKVEGQVDINLNLIGCTDKNKSGHPRFNPSPVVFSLLHKQKTGQLKKVHREPMIALQTPPIGLPYIIPVGVAHNPDDWCGPDKFKNGLNANYPDRKNLFEWLNEDYLKDLQNGMAYLLIDQTHEGYHPDWLFQWFHNSCDSFGIPVNRIIYLTGDMNAVKNYKYWADTFGLDSRLNIISWPHFETVIFDICSGYHGFDENIKFANDHVLPPGLKIRKKFPHLIDQLNYKKANYEKIKTFDILQKRTRKHRVQFYKGLYDADLIKDNIVSMNTFDYDSDIFLNKNSYLEIIKNLPLLPFDNPKNYEKDDFESSDGANYILYLNDETMYNSFCTVVSEVFYNDEDPCFISEKTFKPIACSQPFIILGNYLFLETLKELGYKTFHPIINEKYDTYDDPIRLRVIILEMKRIQKLSQKEKLEWYLSMQDILQHNFEIFNKRQRCDNVTHLINMLLSCTEF